MTLNFADIRVAIRIPREVREDKKGIKMKFSSWLENENENEKEKLSVLEVKLEKVTDIEELRAIEPLIRPMSTTLLYKIADHDIVLINQFLNEYQRKEAVFGKKLAGSNDITASYCRIKEVITSPVLVSNWIQIDKNSGLLPLFINKNLVNQLKESKIPTEDILPMCRE